MKHVAPPIAIDLLDQAVQRIRKDLDSATTLRVRARVFWAGVLASRELGARDVVEVEFWRLAFDAGLIWDQANPDKGRVLRHSYETVSHLIRWGLLERDPFGERRR
jgi:hypothetical protein